MKLSHRAKWGRSRNRKKEEEQPHLSTQFHGTFIEFIGVRDTRGLFHWRRKMKVGGVKKVVFTVTLAHTKSLIEHKKIKPGVGDTVAGAQEALSSSSSSSS